MIDRRAFLAVLLGTAAAEAIDFERLLWIPKPIITVPEMPLRYTAPLDGFWTDDLLQQLVRFSNQIADDTYARAVDQYLQLTNQAISS